MSADLFNESEMPESEARKAQQTFTRFDYEKKPDGVETWAELEPDWWEVVAFKPNL